MTCRATTVFSPRNNWQTAHPLKLCIITNPTFEKKREILEFNFVGTSCQVPLGYGGGHHQPQQQSFAILLWFH